MYFVEQFRIAARKELLELPAGKIEFGEAPLAAAERELREETGMAAGEIKLVGEFYMSPGMPPSTCIATSLGACIPHLSSLMQMNLSTFIKFH